MKANEALLQTFLDCMRSSLLAWRAVITWSRLRLDLLQRVLERWRESICSTHHDAQNFSLGSQSCRHSFSVFIKWHEKCKLRRWLQWAGLQISMRTLRRVATVNFQVWWLYLCWRQRIRRVMSRLCPIGVRLVMKCWKENACREKRRRQNLSRTGSACMRLLASDRYRFTARTIHVWMQQVVNQRRMRHVGNKAARIFLHGACARGFSGWKEKARRQVRGRAVCTKALRRLVSQRMGRSWEAWVAHAEQGRKGRTLCARIVLQWCQRSLWHALAAWRSKADTLRRAKQTTTRILQRWTSFRLAASFESWRDCAQEQVWRCSVWMGWPESR